ncbi:hypothetical protein DDF62_21820 [Caulobacter radicis]|uniref:hypothetical protein n=1 Tax=Caulobacter radicis TaxID=2172650 RepID=UPI000D567885|nr:hypothetical protein [Caulobacter radicis]PVM84747.1 hypothetical protein DDF62_21820 [Caulobacter radicis]
MVEQLREAELRDAVKAGERIDATAGLGVRRHEQAKAGGDTTGPRGLELRRPGHIPPFLFAAYQRQRLGEPDGSRDLLDYRAFELLSLLARTTLFKDPVEAGKRPSVEDRAADKRLAELKLDEGGIAPVDADVILNTLCWMADCLADPRASPECEPLLRRGLQLVGCRIVRIGSNAPLDLANLKLPFPVSFIGCVFDVPLMVNESEMISLDLSGSALPGLEARGLRTTGGVHLRRTTVISPVSFSGARIGGIFDASDALITQMQEVPWRQVEDADHGVLNLSKAVIHNEVLLERTRVWGGLSMRGAEAHRSVFLTGAVVASPLAVLEKWAYDVLSEPRVGKIKDEAVRERLEGFRDRHQRFGAYDKNLAKFELHDPFLPTHTAKHPKSSDVQRDKPRRDVEAMVDLECVVGSDWSDRSLEIILTESLRARTNAIRADGLKIVGNLFAEHLQAHGRVRLKSADISGSVRLSGATLRSGDETRTALLDPIADFLKSLDEPLKTLAVIVELQKIVTLRTWTGHAIDRPAKFVAQDYALDMREVLIGGDVSFMPGEQTPLSDTGEPPLTRGRPAAHRPAELHGVVSLGGASVRGSVYASNARFEWKPAHDDRVVQDPGQTSGKVALRGDDLYDRQAVHDEDENAARAEVDCVNGRPLDQRSLQEQYGLILRQATIGKDLDLRESEGLWGLQLEEARIAGRLRCCQVHSGADLGRDRRVPLKRRAVRMGGMFNLRGAKIGSDCHLIFDPDQGPTIKAENCVVDGHLNIYPSVGARRYTPHAPQTALSPDLRNAFVWQGCAHSWVAWRDQGEPVKPSTSVRATTWPHEFGRLWSRLTDLGKTVRRRAFARAGKEGELRCIDCGAVHDVRRWRGRDRKEWFIDLRNARATVFCHPPSAWPHPGALSLDSFRYEQSSSLGPLPPVLADNLLQHPPLEPGAQGGVAPPVDHPHRVAAGVGVLLLALAGFFGLAVRGAPLGAVFQPLLMGAALLAVVFAAPWREIFRLRQVSRPGDRRSPGRKILVRLAALLIFGAAAWTLSKVNGSWMEEGFHIALVAIGSLFATAIILALAMAQPGLQHRPLGLEYLARQRSEPNRFQFLTSRYSPNEPYRTAAQALREVGRYLAANEIEQARIGNRNQLLSWRQHGVSKAALFVADWLSGFGFRLDRLAGTIVAAVLVVAFSAHYAANQGWMEFDDKAPDWSATLAQRPPVAKPLGPDAPPPATQIRAGPVIAPLTLSFDAGPSAPSGARPTCRQRAEKIMEEAKFAKISRKDPPKSLERELCPGLMYAVDLLFPLDLDQPRWKVKETALADMPTWAAGPARNVMGMVQLFGAVLVAFFFTALALRAEAAFTRVEE